MKNNASLSATCRKQPLRTLEKIKELALKEKQSV